MKKLRFLYSHCGLLLLLVCLLTMGTFTGISANESVTTGNSIRFANPDDPSGYAFPQMPLSAPKVSGLTPKASQSQESFQILKINKTSNPESDDKFKLRVKIYPKLLWNGQCQEKSVTEEMLSADGIPEQKSMRIVDMDNYYCNVSIKIWSALEYQKSFFDSLYPNNTDYIQLAYKIIDSAEEYDFTPPHIADKDNDFEKEIRFENADELLSSLYCIDPYVYDKNLMEKAIKDHFEKDPVIRTDYAVFNKEFELKAGQTVVFYIISINGAYSDYSNISDLLTFEVEETETSGYTPDKNPQSGTISNQIHNPTEVTIHNTKPEVLIKAEKTWEDFDNKHKIRPDEITLKILANGEDTNQRLTLSAENSWKAEITLPQIDANGKEIDYTLEEFVPKGYTVSITQYNGIDDIDYAQGEFQSKGNTRSITGNTYKGFILKNTLETVNIPVEKIWREDSEEVRPVSITIKLLGAEEKTIETISLSAENNWEHEFKNLNKFDHHGEEIDYQIIEQPVENYIRDPQTETGYSIVNIYSPGMEDLPVVKVWDDEDDQDGIRPTSITVQLYEDGVAVEGQTLTLDSSNHWKGEFIIPLNGKTYTVQEIGAPFAGYNQPVITGSQQEGWTITNTHVPETTSVTVKKVWNDDNDRDGKRPSEIVVQLFADGEEVPGKRAVLSSDIDWTFTFTDLPKYAIPRKEIKYSISEIMIPDGYETSAPEISASENGTLITLTNTHDPKKISIKVIKAWEDGDDADGSRPDSVTVNLKHGDEIIETLVLSEQNNWSASFHELYEYADGRLIEYTIEEDPVPNGYFSFITGDQEEGFKITNTHEPEIVIEISVTKIWADENDKNNLRPASVTVVLRGDDGSSFTAELSEANNWFHTFENLKKFDTDGIEITYSLEEVSVPEGYTSSVVRADDGSFVITNRLIEETPPEPLRFFRIDWVELPKTGITGFPQKMKPASVKYASTPMELFIPGLNVSSSIVTVAQQDGTYPVEWLGMDAGLLEGTALPGEGNSVIAAHNTLSAEEYGPFALLATLEEGDRFFVRNDDDLIIYTVYANEKIDAADVQSLADIASGFDNTLTLLTCEDEQPEGGYASRRIVSGRVIGE